MSVGCTRGCPARVRPGTPSCFCLLCCRCVPRPSLGVQGALVARLLDPLPLGRPGLFARISRKPDARCHSLRPKGKGYRPCTPTNRPTHTSTSSPNIRAVRPRRWGEQAGPPHEHCVLFCRLSSSTKVGLLAVPSDIHRPRLSGRCRRSVVAMFWARFRGNRRLSVSPNCYGRTETPTAGSLVSQC